MSATEARPLVAAVLAVKAFQGLLLAIASHGFALPLVPGVETAAALRAFALSAIGLALVLVRPSFMAWGLAATVFALSLTSHLRAFDGTPWVFVSLVGSAIGLYALIRREGFAWWRRFV